MAAIKVKSKVHADWIYTINEEDFDESKHERIEEPKKQKKDQVQASE